MEPWAPEVTDAEEPTVLDVVLQSDPDLYYVPGARGGACVDFNLTDGSRAVSRVLGDRNSDELLLPEDIAQTLQRGDRVRLPGRWAHVRLEPNHDPNDDWVFQSIRMFIVEGYKRLRREGPNAEAVVPTRTEWTSSTHGAEGTVAPSIDTA